MKRPFSKLFLISVLVTSSLSTSANAQIRSFDKFCSLDGYESAMRETHIVIDSSLITSESGTPLPENRAWRQRITRLMNAKDTGALNRWAPRERVTVSIANGDGSGLKSIFRGCMPLYSASEEKSLDETTSRMSKFLGNDWRSSLEDDNDSFRRALTFALVDGVTDTASFDGGSMIASGLGQSLTRSYRPSFQYGVPRLILMGQFDEYDSPKGEIPEVRKQARNDTLKWGADLSRSEVHILGTDGDIDASQKEYLRALYLGAKGNVKTLAGLTGTLVATEPPKSIDVYKGTISYPDGKYPMTLRLALDANGRAVNSWVEVQSDQVRFVPLEGSLNCESEKKCEFVDAGDFAQIWTDNPGGDPEFENWMPFVGFRNIEFAINDQSLSGKIVDSSGYVPGLEEGLPFELKKMSKAAF